MEFARSLLITPSSVLRELSSITCLQGSNSLAASGPSVQTSQTGNAPSAPVIPQQPLPIHPYQHAGVPLGFASVFGYQYGPSSYTYVHHPPYQHSYTSNSAYPQPPTGTGYPQAGGSSYTPGGAGTVKYPMPQYKPGNASGNVPHSAAASGYGGYNATPTGYAANTSVTAGSATVYEDVTGQPYKDNNLYIPSQQVGLSCLNLCLFEVCDFHAIL